MSWQQYISEVSETEAKYVLNAFHSLQCCKDGTAELCQHSNEINFLNKYDAQLHKGSCGNQYPLLKSLQEKFKVIGKKEPLLKILIKDFRKSTSTKSKLKMLLLCCSLLVNFHKKHDCHEYLSLALKFKLAACIESTLWFLRAAHPTALFEETMVEFLDYISFHKCKHILFISYLNVFLDEFGDRLSEVLGQVLDAAHELRFNLLRFWDNKKYFQKSILENVKRYLILVKYGYEEQRYCHAFYYYDIFIKVEDEDNLFGFRKRIIRRRSNKKYRPYQVLYLYIKMCYNVDEEDYGLYDEVLRLLWESIPDSFLSQKQFMSAFEHCDRFPEFVNVWKWYSRIVLHGVEYEKAPRSLKHLSKCAVRRILTVSVQMPYGINALDIPDSLKSYLNMHTIS